MDTYLFKFSACLAIFWLVYVLLLERQTAHHFKRFYLLAALALALIIPIFTITHYVEPMATAVDAPFMEFPSTTTFVEAPKAVTPIFTTEQILWTFYALGVLVFSIRFLKNLYKMYRRISNHKHIIRKPFIYVLLDQCRIPHSFFKYLFFDKTNFETEAIPKEVLLHEQTHAAQLHSLDILILELLQIVFWFHPLIYILKHHIKLNHEFLADDAVLNQGADTKAYQNLLLQFSSPENYWEKEHQFSSTINYSSFKKRFTVMKTQTSKTRFWVSTLLLLPIIAILFYSFAERDYVEKEKNKKSSFESVITEQDPRIKTYDSITTKYSEAIQQFLKGSRSDNSALKTLKSKADKVYNSFTKEELSKHNILPPPPVPAQKQQNPPTEKEISAYNAWAKKIHAAMAKAEASNKNEYPILKQKDVEKYKYIYSVMTAEQKKISEAFPQLPPPPPPPPAPVAPTSPKSRDKTDDSQNKNTIAPVEITIKKDNSLILNGTPIKFEELTTVVDKLNSHLTIEEKRNYVNASIKLETNESKDLAKKIGQELTKVDVFSNSISFNVDDVNQKIPSNHYSPNAGLTIGEAKAKKENDLKAYEESLASQKKKTKSPWAISVATTSVEAVDNSIQKQGPIEINGANYYFTQQNGKTTYYDSYGKEVDINRIQPPAPDSPIVPKASEKGNNGENVASSPPNPENFEYGNQIPDPPKPPNTAYEFVKSLKNDDIIYYFEDKKVSYSEILKITKDNPNISVHSNIENNTGYVKFWIED